MTPGGQEGSVPSFTVGSPSPALRVDDIRPYESRRGPSPRPACYGFTETCPVPEPSPAERKSPLEKGAVSEADWGFLPQMQHRGEKPPGIAFGHASPLFKGGKTGGHTGPPLRHDRTRSDIQKFLIPNS